MNKLKAIDDFSDIEAYLIEELGEEGRELSKILWDTFYRNFQKNIEHSDQIKLNCIEWVQFRLQQQIEILEELRFEFRHRLDYGNQDEEY